MTIFSELKLIDKLRAEGKLNPIYLDKELEDLISVIPTSALTGKLYYYSIGKRELSKEQVNALISDIKTLKIYGLWDKEEELKTIERCKENIERSKAYELLSPEDQDKYDREFIKQFDI